jgi:hypothetical protein
MESDEDGDGDVSVAYELRPTLVVKGGPQPRAKRQGVDD